LTLRPGEISADLRSARRSAISASASGWPRVRRIGERLVWCGEEKRGQEGEAATERESALFGGRGCGVCQLAALHFDAGSGDVAHFKPTTRCFIFLSSARHVFPTTLYSIALCGNQFATSLPQFFSLLQSPYRSKSSYQISQRVFLWSNVFEPKS
jgi:hypothetical protein